MSSIHNDYTSNHKPRPWLTYSDLPPADQDRLAEEFDIETFIGFEYQGQFFPFRWFARPQPDGFAYPIIQEAAHLRIKLNETDETVIIHRLK